MQGNEGTSDGAVTTRAIDAEVAESRVRVYAMVGFLMLLIGGGGLVADYTLPWFSSTLEMERPIIGLVNEGAPWIDQDRAELAESYSRNGVSFYTQGFLVWTWAAWLAAIAGGLLLMCTEPMRRWPRARDGTRTAAVLVVLASAAMMLLTVSRRLGRLFIDRHYNGFEFYTWKGTIWTQGIGAVLLVGCAAWLLVRMRRTHPPIDRPDVRAPHPHALRLVTTTATTIALALLATPWLPLAEFQLPAIVGNQWWGENAVINLADDGTALNALAGQGYIAALRALFVTMGTAMLAGLALVAWERAPTRSRARAWALTSQIHALVLFPLVLGLYSYDLYIGAMHDMARIVLLSNQFTGFGLPLATLFGIMYAVWTSAAYQRWPRAEPEAVPELGTEAP